MDNNVGATAGNDEEEEEEVRLQANGEIGIANESTHTHMDIESGDGTQHSNTTQLNRAEQPPGHIDQLSASQQCTRLTQHAVPAWRRSAVYARRFVQGRIKEKLQHIRIVYMLLNSISIDHILNHIEVVAAGIQEQWLVPALGSSLTDQHRKSVSISDLVACLSTRSPASVETQCPPAIPQCIDAAIRVLNSSYKLRVLQSALLGARTSGSSNSPAQSKQHTVLADCIEKVYDALGQALSRSESVTTPEEPASEKLVGKLVDDIVSLVYREPALSTIRRTVTDVLRGVGTDAWGAALSRKFLAQSLEVSIAQRYHRRSDCQAQPGSLASESPDADQDVWRGRWLLNTQKKKASEVDARQDVDDGRSQCSLSVLQFLCYLQQLVCIDITLDGYELRVASVLAASMAGDGATLVLDGRDRVLRTFPDGLATLTTLASIDEWTWGDYSGIVSADRLSLILVLCCFQTQIATNVTNEDNQTESRTAVFRLRVI